MKRERIFIAIASFRDPECQHTVADAFLKASYPERIFAGICWQADTEQDKDCFEREPLLPSHVRAKHYRVEESKGGCWARAEALSLWQGEEYILQIDAHMRFAPGWDVLALDALARCPQPKAVLSTMPPFYDPPEKLQDCSWGIPLAYVKRLGTPDEMQPLHIAGHFRPLSQTHNQPVLGAFFVGNFLFAPSQAITEVPFDPHIFFRGQELVYSARLWTHGWNIYQPDRIIVYHYWASKSRPMLGNGTHYKETSEASLIARKRVMHLLEVEHTDDSQALKDLANYGMGKARTLADYWKFTGVDLIRRTIEDKAIHVQWTAL